MNDEVAEVLKVLKVKHFIICLLKELNSLQEFKCHITQAK